MTAATRGPRTAGTRTWADVLRAWVGRGRRPEDDIEHLAGGGELRMACYVMVESGRPKQRTLVIGRTEAAADDLRSVLGAPPYTVYGAAASTSRWIKASLFSELSGASSDGYWRVAIPTADLATFRHVVAAANRDGRSG